MTYNFLSYILCCCFHTEQESHDILADPDDETTRLIPDNFDPSIYTDPALISHHRMQKKLDKIVRAKESKMVNIGSQIPFNLHNQVVPPNVDQSLSRNASSTSYYFDSAGGYSEGMYHRQQSYPPAPDRRFMISASPDPYSDQSLSRSESMDRHQEHEPPTPILNVRLVNFVDRRGRTIRRNQSDNAMDSTASNSTPTASTLRPLIGDSSSSTTASMANLKLHEAGAISLSWGD